MQTIINLFITVFSLISTFLFNCFKKLNVHCNGYYGENSIDDDDDDDDDDDNVTRKVIIAKTYSCYCNKRDESSPRHESETNMQQ